jgi:hypothetical protein
MVVPGLLDGFNNVGRLINRWLPGRIEVPDPRRLAMANNG